MGRFDCTSADIISYLPSYPKIWRFEHPEVAKYMYILRHSRRMYRLLKGVKISISTDRNVDNEFIPGYSKK
jgi:hypothetical protein